MIVYRVLLLSPTQQIHESHSQLGSLPLPQCLLCLVWVTILCHGSQVFISRYQPKYGDVPIEYYVDCEMVRK